MKVIILLATCLATHTAHAQSARAVPLPTDQRDLADRLLASDVVVIAKVTELKAALLYSYSVDLNDSQVALPRPEEFGFAYTLAVEKALCRAEDFQGSSLTSPSAIPLQEFVEFIPTNQGFKFDEH